MYGNETGCIMSRFIKAPATVPTHYHYMQHQWYATATDDVAVPFGASTVEATSGTPGTTFYDDSYWIAPFAGKLVKVYFLCKQAADTCDIKLTVNGSLGASVLSGGTVEVSAETVATFTCDQNNTFSLGDKINLFLINETAPRQSTMTSVCEID